MLLNRKFHFKKLALVILAALAFQHCSVKAGISLPGNTSNNVPITLGGVITGLSAGEVLILQNNGNDNVTITGSGAGGGDSFQFATKLNSGESYYVTILSQPLTRNCVVGGNAGTAANSDIFTIQVSCGSAGFVIGGTVSSLQGSGLVIKNSWTNGSANGSENLAVNGNGLFSFPTVISSGSTYAVTIATQPSSPSQTCAITGGTGTVAAANINNIGISCITNSFAVSGTVSGLNPLGSIVLQNNNGNDQTVSGATSAFSFPAQLDGYGYNVTIISTTGGANCFVNSNSGTLNGSNITNVYVVCSYGGTFTVGGTVSGLNGGTLNLANGTDHLAITNNGAFTFTQQLPDLNPYGVTVSTQPTSPSQICLVTGGANGTGGGTIATANVTIVIVTCTTNVYTVGGTVSGLPGGASVTLQNNGANNQVVTNPATLFSFGAQASGTIYNVTVLSSTLGTNCSVSSGVGLIGSSNVSLSVTCAAVPLYTIGGTITGLSTAASPPRTGLVLQNNGGNNLTLTSNGSFQFSTAVTNGASYSVSILSQPTNPGGVCTITNAAGVVSGSNVINIAITCSINTYAVSGTITGLGSDQLVLSNNGGNNIAITGGGSNTDNFTFAAQNDLTSYNVTFVSVTGGLSCTPGGNAGTINGANATSVTVTCGAAPTYTVGVNVSNFSGTTNLMLANNGGNYLAIAANGIHNFSTTLLNGAGYNLSIVQQPGNPNTTCSFTGGFSGTIASANVTFGISCVINKYSISGTVAGLAAAETVTLLNNGADNKIVTGGGSGFDNFTFATTLNDLSAYNVTVLTPPSGKTCTAGANTGTLAGSNVGNVTISCSAIPKYTVGGAVTGLIGTVVLRNNGGDNLSVTANGAFTFATPLVDTTAYSVTVLTQPGSPNQVCTISNGSGTIATANINNVNVSCVTNQYMISVTVTGLPGGDPVTLMNNGSNAQSVSTNSTFPLWTQNDATTYNVTVANNPATRTCTASANTGTLAGSNVIVTITCSTASTYTVGGSVTGLATGSVTLSLNSGLSTGTVNANGNYSFAQAVSTGLIYSVAVTTQPTNPNQTCTVSGANGTVVGANVTSVTVNCITNTYTISGTVAGLAGGENVPIMVNNSSAVIANGPAGTYTTAAINDGTNNVPLQIVGMPSTKDCNFDSTLNKNNTVTIGGSNVTGINVTCTVLTAGVQVSVTGMTANGLSGLSVLNNISGNNSSTTNYNNITLDGTYAFPQLQAAGTGYQVLVTTQPAGGICTVAGGTGVMGGSNVIVNISCSLSGGGGNTVLILDTPTAGNVSPFGTNNYQITGISSGVAYNFSVTGMTGNVNLYVFSNSSFTTVACSSANTGLTNDVCSASGSTAYYIKVINTTSSTANYNVKVNTPPANQGSVGTPISLTLNTPYSGTVANGGSSYYQISGLGSGSLYTFNISGLTSTADINVYSTADFATTLKCSSANAGTADDSCTTSGSTAYYIKVFGNVTIGANYTIQVSLITPTTIPLATPTTSTIQAGGASYYQITGLSATASYIFDLNGLAQDVNMLVYTDALFSTSACSLPKTGILDESCAATGSTSYYIKLQGVNGSGAGYTLTVSTPTTLVLATPTGGMLTASKNSYYQIIGLTGTTVYTVTLTGLSNDVDLLVYSINTFTTLKCSSANPGTANESCSATGSANYYIKLTGMNGANYTVNITAPALVNQGSTGAPINLGSLNTPYSGTIAAAGTSYYTLTVPSSTTWYQTTVTGMSANVDLYIYTNSAFTTLLGSSLQTGVTNEVGVASGTTTWYYKVTGTTAAAFTINVVDTAGIPLTLGVPGNYYTLGAFGSSGAYSKYFQVTVPSSVTTYNFSITGFASDLDLRVDSTVTNSINNQGLVCSLLTTALGGSENCNGTGFTTYYIGVNFWTGSADAFTILVQ